MKTKKLSTKQLTVLGLMIAVLVLMSYTPLGYLNIGPLAITFNMIPVAIAAIACGPLGGAVLGAVFGLTSFGQCIGIGGVSAMGATLFSISPILAFIQRFVPRFLDGWLLGYLFRWLRKVTKNTTLAGYITGFLSAFLNTVFFMVALVVLFGNTDYVKNLIGGRNIIVFICAFVGVNAICEMISATILTGVISVALKKARLILQEEK
ncbi:ECF transporter S component [Roseburia sp. NSJ-9]|uniref:ECF transporter S component n=1 Tax=Roseburia lenta TaxID=2763061 RepID=A0ABR7GI80_9FIRM|nr:ECF transporter S component [Roseburia lenta]MBC5686993.1 ECF transporter S component [Roseburia lenta]